jgi:hypothetical protein
MAVGHEVKIMLVELRGSSRSTRASSIVLFAALFVVMVGIAIASAKLIGLLGGGRQLQNATDSGNLSIAQNATTQIGTPLQSGSEQDNFAAFVNNSGQIDLANYNGIVGQCIWVSLNAEAENTSLARSNCQMVTSLAEGSGDSVGQRLFTALNTASGTDGFFTNLANSNPIGLLGDASVQPADASYAVGFMNPNGLTNIALDPSNTPLQANGTPVSLPSNLLSSTNSSLGFPYVTGYSALAFNQNQVAVTLSGVSVQPNQMPHLVSNSDFNGLKQQPVSNLVLPPNSFQSVATATDKHIYASASPSSPALSMTSSSIIGLLNQDTPASVPHGFITITNGSGDADNSPLPSNESIFNNQLFTGIFVANNGVFCTDESLIQAWADYNNSGQSGQAPPTDELFNVNGAPVSGEQNKITQLGGNGFPMMCDYTNVQGPNAIPAAAALLPAFENAYPAPISNGNVGCTLTAVEKVKAEVMELYSSGQGGTPASVGTTGMRYFNHGATYVAGAGQSPEFTRPGNLVELCNQATQVQNTTTVSNSNPVIAALKQRMREIKPTATDSEMNQLLTGNTIDLGQTFYIWVDDTNTFRMTQTVPQWKTGIDNTSVSADGSATPFSVSFPTIGLSVDPVGECGFNQTLFAQEPNAATQYLGVDTATWTPSSGASNLLGTLSFSETISGTAIVSGTPPTNCSAGPYINAVENYMNNVDVYYVGQQAYTAEIMTLGQGHVTSVGYTPFMGQFFTTVVTFDDSPNCGLDTSFTVSN